jgi:hypothetical protein
MRAILTREQFFAAIERFERQLSPKQGAAGQKALSQAAMDFRPAFADPLAQVRNATEALVEPIRSARELGKWIHDVRDHWAVTFRNSLALSRGSFEPLSRLRLPEIVALSSQLQKSLEHSALFAGGNSAARICAGVSRTCSLCDVNHGH